MGIETLQFLREGKRANVRLKGPDFPMGIETLPARTATSCVMKRLKGPDFPMGIETQQSLLAQTYTDTG